MFKLLIFSGFGFGSGFWFGFGRPGLQTVQQTENANQVSVQAAAVGHEAERLL